MAERKLVPPALLPDTLYNLQTGVLKLPPDLVEQYRQLVQQLGLEHLTVQEQKGPVGGPSKEQTDRHLAWAFAGSAARAELCLLDPFEKLTPVSNAFVETLAGNRVCLTDAPSGSGASSLCLVCAIAELRRANVLPREPLDVHVISAEISDHARHNADALWRSCMPGLASQGIFVTHSERAWDGRDEVSTADLVKTILASPTPTKRLVLVSNFSAFLEHEKNRSQVIPQIKEILRYVSGDGSLGVWLEPQGNRSESLINALLKLAKTWTRFFRLDQPASMPSPVFSAECSFSTVWAGIAKVRVAVLRFLLTRE